MTSGLLNLALIVVGFAGMEAVTYVVHRFVMHGPFKSLHRSHHRNAAAAFANKRPEPNDVFPAAFSMVVIAALWVGFNVSGFAWLCHSLWASRCTASSTPRFTTESFTGVWRG